MLLMALVGLVVGPFLGIAVDRAVERERPELLHRCQHCSTSLGPRSLVPVYNWFVRCPADALHRSWRYVLVDVSTAATFALAASRFDTTWMLGPYLALFSVLVVLCIIDVETHLLVNILTYPTFAVGVFAVLTLSGPQGHAEAMVPALVGAGVFGGIILLAFIAYPPGMGLGDAKLAPTLGLALGWLTTSALDAIRLSLYALILGLLGAALVGLGLRATRVLAAKAEIPMGPGLVLGTLAVLAFSEQLTAF